MKPDAETDRALRLALGEARLPDTLWPGLVARLNSAGAEERATTAGGRRSRRTAAFSGSEAIPALAAVASFCILFQLYLAGGAGLAWGRLEGLVSQAVLLAQRWALWTSTLLTGG